MGYKVGDEVFIKGEVVEVVSAVPYPTKVRLGKGGDAYLFLNDELCFADEIVKTYEIGLSDAWQLAKKIVCHEEQGGMSIPCFSAIFDEYMTVEEVLASLTAEEALAKIEAYEKEKSEIKVGDEVRTTYGDTYWIIGITDSYVFGYLSDTKRNMFPVQKLEGLRFTKNRAYNRLY